MDTAQAQEVFMQFLAQLQPTSLADFMVYLIFIIAIIASALLPDGNDLSGNLLLGVIVLCIVDLVWGQDTFRTAGNSPIALVAFVVRIGLFLIPWIAGGAARKRDNKGGAVLPLGIVAGFIGVIYMLMSFVPQFSSTLYAPLY